MAARPKPFDPFRFPDRNAQERSGREYVATLRLTAEDASSLATALGLPLEDPTVSEARAYIDKRAPYIATRDYQFRSERPSVSDIRESADRLRTSAKAFLRAALALDDGADSLLFALMRSPRFRSAPTGWIPSMRDWSPSVRDAYRVQNAAHRLYELTFEPTTLKDLMDGVGLESHGRGRFHDPQELKLALVAVSAFEKFHAAELANLSARRARVVEIVARRVLGDTIGRSEFGAIARRALTTWRRVNKPQQSVRKKRGRERTD